MSNDNFNDDARWDGYCNEVHFRLQLSGTEELVICRVLSETLRDCYGAAKAQKDELLITFRKHKPKIEKVAMRLIQAGRYEDDRTILIRPKDV